jgi:hypothetical protein
MATVVLLSSNLKRLLLGELFSLLQEIRAIRSGRLAEVGGSDPNEYLQRRIARARDRLDTLKRIQRREKLVRDRKRQIERDNERRRKRGGQG